jgi:hypothetical protein
VARGYALEDGECPPSDDERLPRRELDERHGDAVVRVDDESALHPRFLGFYQ